MSLQRHLRKTVNTSLPSCVNPPCFKPDAFLQFWCNNKFNQFLRNTSGIIIFKIYLEIPLVLDYYPYMHLFRMRKSFGKR